MLGCGCGLGRDRRGGGLGRPDGHDDEGGTSQQDDGGAAEEGHARIIAELAEPALAPAQSQRNRAGVRGVTSAPRRLGLRAENRTSGGSRSPRRLGLLEVR